MEYRGLTAEGFKEVMGEGYSIPDDFKFFSEKKRGVFSIHPGNGKYGKDGWESVLEEFDIIGEDDICYVCALKTLDYGFEGVLKKDVVALGVHKSRLQKWVATQLDLFDSLN
jgi:hypothetical protein